MRIARLMVTITLSALLLGTLPSVPAQTSASLVASITGYLEQSDGSVMRLDQGRPCLGQWVKFLADDDKTPLTHYWYLNGNKDPYGPNQTQLRFSLGGVGEYVVEHHVYDARGNTASARTSFQSNDCGAQSTATASPTTANTPPNAQIYVLAQRLCVGEKIPFSGSSSWDDDKIVAWSWQFSGPSGTSMADGVEVGFMPSAEGEHTISLTVKDSFGQLGSTAVRYWFYKCYESGDPTMTAYPTSPPTYDSRCDGLNAEYDQFYSDWKYRYNEYVNSGRADPDYESKLNAEREAFESGWRTRWTEAGCDFSGGQTDGCREKYSIAQADFEALQRRYDELWSQHWNQLELARKNYSAEYHSREEWAAFEERWARAAEDLSGRQQAEIEAVVAKHGLYECGFYYGGYGPTRADYTATYGDAPVAQSAYDREVSECESKLYAIRESYGPRLDALYKELYSLPPGDAYDQKKRELAALEQQMQDEMSGVMTACRESYKEEYEAPSSYRESAGSLECFFDEAIKRIVCRGKYVGFEGNPDTQQVHSYQCGGQFFFEQIYASSIFEDFQFQDSEDGALLAIRAANLKLLLHDSPRGVINVGVVSGAQLYFVPAGFLRVDATSSKVVLEGAGSRGVFFGGDGTFEWDALKRVLTVKNEATWASETCFADGARVDGSEDGKYFEAIEQRRLGAAITISFDGGVNQADEKYDEDMDVEVKRESDKKYQAIIDSEDGTCKTVVLKFDGSIFNSVDLKVSMTDEDGRTIAVREADDLDDVLDPCDDGDEGFEYWIVADRLGTQVILSFAHFSEKRVSVEAASVGNVIVPGFGAEMLVVAAAAAVGLGVVSRRRLTR